MIQKKEFKLHDFYTKIFKRYDLINRIFTFGQDQRWRKITAVECLKKNPVEVLDLCCGTGDLTFVLSQHASDNVKITGYDFNENMLSIAREKFSKKQISSVNFLQGDAAKMPFSNEQFDCITIGFGFRNLSYNNPDRDKHIEEIFRIMNKGGTLFILESSVPKNIIFKFLYKIYLYVCLIPLGTILSGNFKAYWYLAHSSSEFYSIKEIRNMLIKKGFNSLEHKSFFFGATNLIKVCK
jgi:demethylmenaquinone methyltransferase/2-methoxy-6-polyprenyl-1,4-benzoquinol methylase